MDAVVTYIAIFLGILVTIVVAVVLFAFARRARKEETLVGFTAKSKDEKYAGYSLLIAGLIIIFFSVYEMVALLTGSVSNVPFGLSNISMTTGGQTSVVASGQVLGLIVGIPFWLLFLYYGGRKFAVLGLGMLRGRKVKLRRSLRKTQTYDDS
jgi:hypothetical protein